jgi:hypothetical protein
MGNIKSLLSLLVGFIMAFLLGIAGYIAVHYIFIKSIGPGCSGATVFFVAILTGYTLGSSLGIFITKRFLFRTGKFSVFVSP